MVRILPVVMFTAMRRAEDAWQAIYAGAQDFLSKPFDPADLVARVDTRSAVTGQTVHDQPLSASSRRLI